MRYVEREHAYILDTESRFPIITGFTKPAIKGNSPAADIARALPFTQKDIPLGYMNQLHGPHVRYVEEPGLYDCDGLITKPDKMALAVKTADCMPLMFYSRQKGVIGAIHMGWRCAMEGILDNVGFDLSSFVCFAGVGLRECCYRVGGEFLNYPLLAPFVEDRRSSFYFNPVKFIKSELLKKGMKEENFFDAEICSMCSEKEFHSHRRGKTADRTLSFILAAPQT